MNSPDQVIRAVPAPEAYVNSHTGVFLLAASGPWLNQHLREESEETAELSFVPLSLIAPSGLVALTKLGLAYKDIEALRWAGAYTCPFNGYQHRSVVAHGLLTRGVGEKYPHLSGEKHYDVMLDLLWCKRFRSMSPTALDRSLLGPGYPHSDDMESAARSLRDAYIALDNGDFLVLSAWHRISQ